MTPTELRNLIVSDATATALAEQGDDAGCAARCITIAPPTLVVSRHTYLSLARDVGTEVTRRLAETMDAVAPTDALVKKVEQQLNRDGIDVSHETVRTMLDGYGSNAAMPLTSDDANAIKALAEAAPRITSSDIAQALAEFRSDGSPGRLTD